VFESLQYILSHFSENIKYVSAPEYYSDDEKECIEKTHSQNKEDYKNLRRRRLRSRGRIFKGHQPFSLPNDQTSTGCSPQPEQGGSDTPSLESLTFSAYESIHFSADFAKRLNKKKKKIKYFIPENRL
jgi:hypothetical protein